MSEVATRLVTRARSGMAGQSRRRVLGSALGLLVASGALPAMAGNKNPGDYGAYPDCRKNSDCPVGERCYAKQGHSGFGKCKPKKKDKDKDDKKH